MHYAALVGVYAVYFVAERDWFLFVNIESILPPSSLVQMCFVFISYGSLQWVAFECITVQFIYVRSVAILVQTCSLYCSAMDVIAILHTTCKCN